MKTPICDFVNKYAKSCAVRLHMPGHKGKALCGPEALDITEIDGADVLYCAGGIIAQSLENARSLFGTAKTLYSTEGSSLCIRAMIRLLLDGQKNDGRRYVLAARNAHRTFLGACALLDVDVDWIMPEECGSVISCNVECRTLERMLSARDEKPLAVYVTSPDYLGNVCDIEALASVCHSHGTLLVVDNAHGAYLNFLPDNKHPIALGADMCCDSAHKTLPVLTGGAYLHISKNAPEYLCDGAEGAMELFASTSPSYLILQSLDRANAYLDSDYRQRLADVSERIAITKQKLRERGYCLVGNEPIKLSLAPKSYGYTGRGIADILLEHNVVCEFSDPDFCVMMLTPEISDEELSMLENILCSIEKREPVCRATPIPKGFDRVVSVRKAMLSASEEISVECACGRVLAAPSVSCPPAVPIVVCGERIDEKAIECFKYYGIEKVRVIK